MLVGYTDDDSLGRCVPYRGRSGAPAAAASTAYALRRKHGIWSQPPAGYRFGFKSRQA